MSLPKHPVPMRTVFRRCLLVNFAVDPDVLRSALPPAIEPDLHDGEAYLSVVAAELDRMRPAFLPRAAGITYNQIVYRAVVRCGDERGVHFLRSDADNGVMCALGNALSFFRFHRSAIAFHSHEGVLDLDVATTSDVPAGIRATYTVADARTRLPDASAFGDLAQAQAWLVELYAAFAHSPGRAHVDVVRIARGGWNLRVVDDLRGHYAFMSAGVPFGPGTARLDSIFLVDDIAYSWHRRERVPIHRGR
jgi:uncharacterized protein YqjF (DUF2071 family)